MSSAAARSGASTSSSCAARTSAELVIAGALAEPADRAILVFDVAEPATIEAFVAADPYVREGLITQWRIRPWSVVVGPGVALP
jgi:uncharacterized protein